MLCTYEVKLTTGAIAKKAALDRDKELNSWSHGHKDYSLLSLQKRSPLNLGISATCPNRKSALATT